MAIGWLTVLQSVPWSDVISNAPKVAEGAKKLWNMVGRKSVPPDSSEMSTQPAGLSEAQTLAALSDRTVALEAAVADLHDQMLASSELIKALAEQNAQLIQRIEANRVRVQWIGAAVVTLALAALVGLLLVLR
jgi:hypothetical protein